MNTSVQFDSYDGINNSKKPLGMVSSTVKSTGKKPLGMEGGILVDPPDVVETKTHTQSKNYESKLREYEYSCKLEGSRIKFLTIRPHDEFMYGRYNITSRSEALRCWKKLLNTYINYPYIGSIEENNKIFLHTHLIILCSNQQLENLVKQLKPLFTVNHVLGLKQYAVMKQKPAGPKDRLFMIKYYLGLKHDPATQRWNKKPSYVCNVLKEWPLKTYNECADMAYDEVLKTFCLQKSSLKKKSLV